MTGSMFAGLVRKWAAGSEGSIADSLNNQVPGKVSAFVKVFTLSISDCRSDEILRPSAQ